MRISFISDTVGNGQSHVHFFAHLNITNSFEFKLMGYINSTIIKKSADVEEKVCPYLS